MLIWKDYLPIEQSFYLFNFHKGSVVQKLLHQIKYDNRREFAFDLGKLLGEKIKAKSTVSFDYIIPIPLHKDKQKKRGYNQAEEFGRGISKSTRVLLLNCCERTIATSTQTAKNKVDRIINTEGIFNVKPLLGKDLKGKHLLIVDDVLTTGATLESIYHTVMLYDPASISFGLIAFARK